MKRFAVIFIAGLFVALTVVGGFVLYHAEKMENWLTTANGEEQESITVTIPEGASLRGALRILVNKGLVADSPYIRYIGRFGRELPPIQAGEYELAPNQSPVEILQSMAKGKVKTYSITIPEGLTVSDIGQLMEKAGLGTKKELELLAKDKDFLAGLRIPRLEGYLFPDTYLYPKNTGVRELVLQMLANFNRQVDRSLLSKAEKLGFDIEQVLTMASIIEKEAGGAIEYPLVSSVIHNRLKRKMPLQMDPTVIYGAKNYRGNLTRKHLETDHPWNTYTRSGLPPSPICNPGLGAIKAAVEPAKTNYLYFVSMNNGRHKFTSTFREHNKAVQKYQVRRAVGP